MDTAGATDADTATEDVPEAPDPSAFVFDPGTIHVVRIEMTPDAWRDVSQNPWATTWHEADVTWGDETLSRVGIRAFGAGSMVAGKPSLKLSLDHWVEGAEWRSLDEIKLDNSSQDYGFLNERIATSAVRAAGLPASRTGWARVEVNGTPVGFFVVLESIDDRFVERWFGHDDGHLYSTNEHYYGLGLNPIPESLPADPLTWFAPQTSAGGDGTDLVALAETLAHGTDDELAAAMDLDQFVAVTVIRAAMGALDDFAADGNNFYLYDDHGSWKLLPWDFDAELGYPWYFTTALAVDPRRPWATSPWAYNCVTGEPFTDPVMTRALAIEDDVDARLADLLDGPLRWADLAARIEESADLVRDDVWSDALGYGPSFEVRRADLQLFLHARLSRLAGHEVADCPPAPAGVLRAADLGASGTVGWGSLLVDRTDWGPGFVVNGRHACTGFFAHAPSDVGFRVPDGYGTLSGRVGLQDWARVTPCDDGATFEIVQDGAVIWASGSVAGYTDPVSFGPVPVDAGEVHLVTGVNGGYACDTTAWLDVELAPR